MGQHGTAAVEIISMIISSMAQWYVLKLIILFAVNIDDDGFSTQRDVPAAAAAAMRLILFAS
jgi:hypothetical protein